MLDYRSILNLIDLEIKNFNYHASPDELYDPIKYTLSNGGKRLRPCLTVMASNLFSDEIQNAISPAIGIELFHNFTLLHDDIMDNALLRRNNPTVHAKWNINTAILSGDAMMILAYEQILKCAPEFRKDVFEIFTETALEVCEGQQLDMNYETEKNVSINEYLEMISLKTASLLGGAMAIGAVIGNANTKDVNLLYTAGINIGIAFQLQDDYLDIYANPDKFGKKLGADIISNKKTYLLISALQSDNKKLVDELNNWLKKKEFIPLEKVEAVTKIYNELNIGNHTNFLAEEYFGKGIKYINQVNVDENRKIILKDMIADTMKREK